MSNLEDAFALQLHAVGLPEPEREYQAIPERRYRWDFAFVAARLLVEIDGGVWSAKKARACPLCGNRQQGAHGTGQGIERDAEKANLAAAHGWYVMRGTPRMVEDGRLLAMVEMFLKGTR